MKTPRDPSPNFGREGSGASLIRRLIWFVQGFWEAFQKTRPWRSFSRFTDVGGSVLTGGMSYQALFAVFAGLWVGFGAFGIVLRGNEDLLDTLVTQINAMIPGLLGHGETKGAVDLTTLLNARTLDWTSVVAAASLLWLAVNWFTGTRRSVRLIFGLEVKKYNNAVLLKLRDFGLALVFALLVLVSAGLTVASSKLMELLLSWFGVHSQTWLTSTLGEIVRYGATLLFDVFLIAMMHRVLAEIRVPWRKLLAGSLLGAIALLVIKSLGTALLGGASSNPLLASFAVLVGLLIWFNLICRTLLLTSAWIACGIEPTLGTSEPSVQSMAEQLGETTSAGDNVRDMKEALKGGRKKRGGGAASTNAASATTGSAAQV